MRIAIVSEYTETTPGGVGNYVRFLTEALRAAGNNVAVVSREAMRESANRRGSGLRMPGRLTMAGEVLRRLSHLEPDVVHVHGPWYLLMGAVAYSWRKKCVGVVATQHTIPNRRYPMVKRLVESFLFRRCSAVAAPSEATLLALETVAGVKLPAVRVCVGAGPGIDTAEGSETDRKGEGKIVGTCSILVYPEKIAGILDLVRAVAILRKSDPTIKLLIVGGSPSGYGEAVVRQAVASAGLRNEVIMRGTVERPWKYLSRADVYVHASHRESLGMSILEAMASGIPVIAARVGGVPEIIRDGENGLLYPPGDVRRLSELIVIVLKDHQLAQRLIAEGNRTVEQWYNWKRVAQTHLDLYQGVLQRANGETMVSERASGRG